MRRRYIDWARAAAILVMIEAHTLDAWTRPSNRVGVLFRDLAILGGFAAPLFLWLAGLGVVLSAERTAMRTGNRRDAMAGVCRRGLEIFILAFLFRLQAFIVTPGSPLVTLFRVDILNIMGPSIVAAGLVWGLAGSTRAASAAYAVLACAVAMLTPVIRLGGWIDVLPMWVQWYIRPFGDFTTFTFFPWSGFVFAGGAVGGLIALAPEAGIERRLQLALGTLGAGLVAGGFYTSSLPTIYRSSAFWSSSPTFFAIRLGILMVTLALLYAVQAAWAGADSRPPFSWLDRLGRSSLFVYWIHVELVYGYATWPLRRHLSLWGLLVAYTVFCGAMYGAVVWKDRVLASRRLRRQGTVRPADPVAVSPG